MKKTVSLLVIAAMVAALVVVPSPKSAEAGGSEAAIVLGAAALGLVVLSIFAKPAPAAVVYPAPQVQGPGPVTIPAAAYTRGGLMVANGATFPMDVFVNNQLRATGLAPGATINFPDVYGSGRVLARSPDNKFAEVGFWGGDNGGVQVVLRAENFR